VCVSECVCVCVCVCVCARVRYTGVPGVQSSGGIGITQLQPVHDFQMFEGRCVQFQDLRERVYVCAYVCA